MKTSWPQAAPVLGLGKTEANPCGWVNYNAPGLDAKKALPNIRIMLAFEENGQKIETARMDSETGKIKGTGPLRLVVPQYTYLRRICRSTQKNPVRTKRHRNTVSMQPTTTMAAGVHFLLSQSESIRCRRARVILNGKKSAINLLPAKSWPFSAH